MADAIKNMACEHVERAMIEGGLPPAEAAQVKQAYDFAADIPTNDIDPDEF